MIMDEDAHALHDDATGKLERQLERSQLFTHTALGEGFAKIAETSSFLYGLLDLLLAKGMIHEAELETAVARVREQMQAGGELAGPGTAIRPDSGATTSGMVAVDCNSRMHVCKAVCCKLNFALSVPEIESGKVKWDLGRPYFIRHEADGYCTHLQQSCGGCSVYKDRPLICRTYSCAHDGRIWKNFEAMELNTEWIAANLPPGVEERRIGTVM